VNRLVVIVGPTGVGKSQLAIRLAETFHGEIVNADSRQLYRHMDIGTAKPDARALARVPHHVINIIDPDEDFSLAHYQRLANQAVNDILKRNRLPLLAGGSGQYVWAVVEGWSIPAVPPDYTLRRELEERAASQGIDQLYQELMMADPEAAGRIDRRNVRRVIRALEVYRQTNQPVSRMRDKQAPPFNTFIIGLTMERTELYRRIDRRVDRMIAQGLVTEVEKLVNMGYHSRLPAMSSIGYQQIGRYLSGELSLAVAVEQIKRETHRFARQQCNWFRLGDKRIHWFDVQAEPYSRIMGALAEVLNSDRIT